MENYKSEKTESINSEDILNQYQFVLKTFLFIYFD